MQNEQDNETIILRNWKRKGKTYCKTLNEWYDSLLTDTKKAKEAYDAKNDRRIDKLIGILEPKIEGVDEIPAAFAYEESIKINAIIWVGIGCAFNKENEKEFMNSKEGTIRKGNVIFIDDKHKKNSKFQYYSAINEFFKKIDIKPDEYSTLELTCLRVTSQGIIEDLLKYERFKDFFDENVNLFLDTLILAKPKMVIIGNGFVSRILGEKLGLTDIDYKRHCWFCQNEGYKKDFENIPIFKTGMLSASGRMSRGSVELLQSVVNANIDRINKAK